MPLNKQQLKHLKRLGTLNFDTDYSEQDLRELVGLETNDKHHILWIDVVEYTFYWFNRFNNDFKREAREQAIQEYVSKHFVRKEQATKEINVLIADSIVQFILNNLHNSDTYEDRYKLLQQIKEGKFYEFINVDEILPFN